MAGGLKKIFGVLLVFSICIFCSNFAEAKAQISWTTTDVILDSKKCTVKGYFTNTGDEGARVTKMHFIVDAVNGKKQNIYSAIFDIVPTDCYITPGQQRNWSFSLMITLVRDIPQMIKVGVSHEVFGLSKYFSSLSEIYQAVFFFAQ